MRRPWRRRPARQQPQAWSSSFGGAVHVRWAASTVLTIEADGHGAWNAQVTWTSGHKITRQFQALAQAKTWCDWTAALAERSETS